MDRLFMDSQLILDWILDVKPMSKAVCRELIIGETKYREVVKCEAREMAKAGD